MSSSSSSSSELPGEPLFTTASTLSARSRPASYAPHLSSRVSNAVTSLEATTSTNNQILFSSHPVGSTIIAQTNPRLQAVVVQHHTTATGSPLLVLFQTGYYDRHAQKWVPPKLRERYANRLPLQQSPPDYGFEDLPYVQKFIINLLQEDQNRQLSELELTPLIDQLNANPTIPAPSPIFIDTSSERGLSIEPASIFEQQATGSRCHTLNPPSMIPMSIPLPQSNQIPADADITSTLEALAKRVEDISLYVRSQQSGSRGQQGNNHVAPSPPSHHSPLPSIRGLPPVHPQLLVDCSPPASNHSHSRSRSRSRGHNSSVRSRKIYEAVYVPCPFSDSRQSMLPAARAKGSAPMRKLYRQVLGDFYSFHHTATRAAKETLASHRASTYKAPTWEEQMLLNYAHLLDLFLLETNSGSWTLWSEPGIDWLVRSFLEMAIRASPKNEPPPFLDPYLVGRIRRLKYGDNHTFGPVTSNKPNRRQPFTLKTSVITGGGASPSTPALLATPPFKKGTTPPST